MERQLLQLTGLGLTRVPRPAPAAPPGETASPGPSNNRQHQYSPPASQQPASRRTSRPPQEHQHQVESPHLVAMRSLLHQPLLAFKVESAKNLAAEDDLHAQLLVSLLEALQKTPQPAPLQLIARWQGTEQGRLLRSLAEKEWLIEHDNLEQQFIDTITCLSSRQNEQKLEQLLELARSRSLDDSEKQQLNHLLAQKHRKPLATGQQ